MSVTPSLSWREEIPVGEAEAHEALAARLVALQRQRAQTRTLGRGRNHFAHLECMVDGLA